MPWCVPFDVEAGQTLRLGAVIDAGARAYVAVRSGFDVPEYLGSRATFVLGRFGGHAGRVLAAGDVLHVAADRAVSGSTPRLVLDDLAPDYPHDWRVRVLPGPHAAPDFFTAADIEMLHATEWEVHHHSDRTGVRLIGPAPEWARADGGEAGLHPSNIHDNAYAVGAIDFTGDMPIILGPDGPSLGGFVCPATVATVDAWKLGQLRPGDRVRFVPITHEHAVEMLRVREHALTNGEPKPTAPRPAGRARRARCCTTTPVTAAGRQSPSGAPAIGTCWWRSARTASTSTSGCGCTRFRRRSRASSATTPS